MTADYVSLRQAGDIINLLPLLKLRSSDLGRNVRLAVHRDFEGLLEGVSYIDPVIWDGEGDDPLAVAKQFHATNIQVCGKNLRPNIRTDNFAKLPWQKLGSRFDRHLPLVFDRRDSNREAALASAVFQTDKPKLLLKLDGFSSPFGERHWVRQKIREQFSEMAEIVSVDEVIAHRLYDLIGLMDQANCLVTSDTVTLWLAHATACPSIQFVNGTGFSASPPRGNCIQRTPYRMVVNQWDQISRVIRKTLTITPHGDSMVHCYSDFEPTDPEAKQRQAAASETWPKLGARLHRYRATNRTSRRLGDNLGMPFVRDMIQDAFGSGTEDIMVLTNNDILFGDGLAEAIIGSCRKHGCYWAYRTNLPSETTDNGADVFAFTRSWWHLHEHLFPDFLLGYWWFDDILVRLMRWSGCMEGLRLYYHRQHTGVLARLNSPGQHYNERLANKWLADHDELREKP